MLKGGRGEGNINTTAGYGVLESGFRGLRF